jgi:hypothetical protein
MIESGDREPIQKSLSFTGSVYWLTRDLPAAETRCPLRAKLENWHRRKDSNLYRTVLETGMRDQYNTPMCC